MRFGILLFLLAVKHEVLFFLNAKVTKFCIRFRESSRVIVTTVYQHAITGQSYLKTALV